jgi:ligand-binding SRPBCC domain-containing protein
MIEVTEKIPVNGSAEELFDFHADLNNINKILPPFIKMKIISVEWPIEKGSSICINLNLFNILPILKWTLYFSEFKRPDYFIDEEKNGLFKVFSHKHRFENNLIEDTMKIEFKESSLFGLLEPLMKVIVKLMLKIKLKITKDVFEREKK